MLNIKPVHGVYLVHASTEDEVALLVPLESKYRALVLAQGVDELAWNKASQIKVRATCESKYWPLCWPRVLMSWPGTKQVS